MKPGRSCNETRKKSLKDPQVAALYLEECLQDGDMELFTAALRHVADARGGVHGCQKQHASTAKRSIAHFPKTPPRFGTLSRVLAAISLRIGVIPA
jgi:DNA-binding phage protein